MTDEVTRYAKSIMGSIQRRPDNFSFPVPVWRLKQLCNAALAQPQDTKRERPPMTEAERLVHTAIKQDFDQGQQPSIRSVASRIEKTPGAAASAIDRLIKKGYVKRLGDQRQIVLDD